MSRPTLDGIKQASQGALDKAKLMVGLKSEEEDQSVHSERSGFVAEAAELICPDLTFQQRLIGFAACFTTGCKFPRDVSYYYARSWLPASWMLFTHLFVLLLPIMSAQTSLLSCRSSSSKN